MIRTAYLMLVVLALAGCATPGDDMPEKTITIQEADHRVERHIRQVAAAAIPGARLEPLSRPLTAPCGGVLGGPEDGRVNASRSYQFRDIPADRIDATIDAAIEHWTAAGYQVRTDVRSQGYIQADATDGTLLALQNGEDYLTIIAYSVCVWPDGTPPE